MKNLPILVLLFLLAACAPAVTESPVTIDTPAPTNTPVPTASLPPSPTPGEIPQEATTRIAQDVLNGTVDLNELNAEQREGIFGVIAAKILAGEITLAEAHEVMNVAESLDLSAQIIVIQQSKMSYAPTLFSKRTGRAAELGVEPEWRGLRLIENPSSLMQDAWNGKVYNTASLYWWGTIQNERDILGLSMPDQLIEAVQDKNGHIHYIDKNGHQAVFTGTLLGREEIIEKMVQMHYQAQGNTKNRETIEKGIVDVYAGILYESADITDIMWNIDPVGIPAKSISLLIPIWNEQGELLYMRKCHALFTNRFYEYAKQGNDEIQLRRIDTSENGAIFFGSGYDESDLGQLVLLTGILDLKAYSLVPYYETNDNVNQVSMDQIQDSNNISDILLFTLGELFVLDLHE